MQILRVELENIKSYERATVNFAPGVNAIMGHNGAGKSTILEAIGFALFDSLPYKTSDFLREGTRSGTVAVTFTGNQDERPYRVERRIGGSHQYVVHDVELQAKLCEGKADVLTFVRRQVGTDSGVDLSELFANAIGVQQGTLVAAFLMAPAQRKQMFDALLQVDDYKEASDKLREPRALLAERSQAIAQEAAVLAARLERLPAIEDAVGKRTTELMRLEQSVAGLCRRLEQVQLRKAQLDTMQLRVEQCELRRTAQVERCAALEAQVAAARQQLEESTLAAEVVAKYQDEHDQYLAAQQDKSGLDQQLRTRQQLREQHANADKTLALAQSELARTEERLAAVAEAEELLSRLAPAVQKQDDFERTLAVLQQERGRWQEAVKSLAVRQVERQQLQEREQRLAGQLARAESLQQETQQLEQAAADLRAAIAQYTGDQAALQAMAGELKRQNEALETVVTAACPVCEQPLTDEHRRQMLARNSVKLQELRNEYAASQKRMKEAEAALKTVLAEQKEHAEALRNLPRAGELQDILQRIAQADLAIKEGWAAQDSLSILEQRYQALTSELAALQNPRHQYGMAAQRAGERPQLVARQAEITVQRHKALERLTNVETELAPLAGLDARLAEVSATLQQTQAAYQAVLSNTRLAASAAERSTAMKRVLQLLQTAQSGLADLEHELTSVQSEFDPVAYASISSEDQSLRSNLGGQETRLALLRQEQAKDELELHVLRGQQEALTSLKAVQDKLSREAEVLETVRGLLRQSGPFVTQALIHQISTGATRIFGELMQDFSRELQWQEDYGIVLKVDGSSRQFVQLSGGEQMSAALAVRLALVREISNIDIAFFDEPTTNLDDIRREALAQQIMNVKGFQQLFVISHDDTFEQATQNLVRVKRHGNSSVIAPFES